MMGCSTGRVGRIWKCNLESKKGQVIQARREIETTLTQAAAGIGRQHAGDHLLSRLFASIVGRAGQRREGHPRAIAVQFEQAQVHGLPSIDHRSGGNLIFIELGSAGNTFSIRSGYYTEKACGRLSAARD